MQEQRRKENARCRIEPENYPVERVELSRIAVRIKNEGDETDIIEMDYMRCSKPLDQNEGADEEVVNADNFQEQALQD
jgi:hypothetical protein